MRAVVQRVIYSDVRTEDVLKESIGAGITVLLGVEKDDTLQDAEYLAGKICGLRIFDDENGIMNLSISDTKGEMLVVSQFTLLGDCRKGKRPSYSKAAKPEKALDLYREFVQYCIKSGITVKEGVFRTEMLVRIDNDGPVTILIDSRKQF